MKYDDLAELLAAATQVAPGRSRDDVAERARWVLADTIGVALAGGRRPMATSLVSDHALTGSWAHESRSDEHSASLLTAGGGWAAADRAAYVNGSILCDLELDEGVRPTGHPAAHVLPAVLAAGQALGADVGICLDALVVGYEVAATLFESFTLMPGVHPHGHIGAIGAAAAIAHVRDIDPLPAALCAATVPLATTWGACLDGATVRNTWAGHAAATGVLAHRLADAGWSGSTTVLQQAFDGPLATYTPAPLPDVDHPRIMNGYFKVSSACALTHSSIDAALTLAPLHPAAISGVRVATTASNMKVAAQPHDSPLSRRFSIPYAVAAALTHASGNVDDFDTSDPSALELASRVEVVEDPAATAMWPQAAPSTVTVTFVTGQQTSARCDNARGTPGNPVTAGQLRDKSARLLGDGGEVWDHVMTVPEHAPLGEAIPALFRRSGRQG